MARTLTEKTRNSILEAAASIIARRGFHDVLTDEIAGEAGVGKGTLYRYFRTKEEILDAALLLGFDELEAALGADRSPAGPPSMFLRRVAEEAFRIFWDRPSFYLFIKRDASGIRAQEREFLRRRARIARIVRETISRGVSSGEFRHVDPRIAAEMFLGMLRGALRYRNGSDSPGALVETLCDLFLSGIASRRDL
ncbi:MAG: TetR/AcrR family transcriptional regulator [Acidithiobacillales bacterium]